MKDLESTFHELMKEVGYLEAAIRLHHLAPNYYRQAWLNPIEVRTLRQGAYTNCASLSTQEYNWVPGR